MLTRWRLLGAALFSAALVATVAQVMPANAAGGPNLAAAKPTSASSTNGGFAASNIADGNQGSYWESSGALPQWVQVDLGASTAIDQVVLKLPTGWGARTQTLSVQGSADGTGFSTIVGSAGQNFSGSNAVTLNFGATNTRFVRINITANTGWAAAQLSELEVYGVASSTSNLAAGKAMSASTVNGSLGAGNANDNNQGSYWESQNNAFPQWLQVDLGSSLSTNRIVLKLPTAGWGQRTQTLSVQSSTTGSNFTTLVQSTGYVFNPATGNTVTINFNATTTRYLRLNITANTGWAAGQISEFEVYGSGTGDVQPPSAPSNLAFTQPASGQIRLTWNASSDNLGVAGYDVYANGTLRTSVAGNVLTYTDNQPDSATVTYFVRAKDAAGNQSGNSNSVTRTGTSTDTQAPTAPSNLAFTQPASGQIRLTWNASSDNVGVTGYDVYAGGSVRASVAGNVLTYTDSQPDSATVTYFVRAKDAAANVSGNSNTVTRNGTNPPGGGTNQAVGKPIIASSHVHTFVATNANDDNLATYWEGNAYPALLTVQLGSNVTVTSIVVKLNPDAAWGPRQQTLQVLGRDQGSTTFNNVVSSATYSFNPSSGNSVTIPVNNASLADVQLRFTANTGAPSGQVAEFQVMGVPAPNPDLTISALTWSPASPVETSAISLTATVRNIGDLGSGATNVNFYLGTTLAGTANVGALAAGAQANVTANIGTRNAGSYQVTAKVDESNTVVEKNNTNNSFTASTNLVVSPVASSDLVPVVSWSPGAPGSGNTVTFTVAIRNQGTIASAGGAHGITLNVLNAGGTSVRALSGSFTGAIAAGATSAPVNLGTWVAANGRYTVRTVLAVDANELPVKQANNTLDQPFFVGRGANMPYEMYEAEDGQVGGGANVVGPNRTIGDIAGEASGRRAVTLNSNGSFVQWTTRASTNTLVVRFSIPDAAGGGGINSTLNIYVNGTFNKAIDLTSRYAWLYGAEAGPGNSPGAGGPRHIYDEANTMFSTSIPAGSTIRLQKDAANTTNYAIDFINLEQVSPIANPDAARYTTPTGFAHQDVQNALDRVRMDTTGNLIGVYLPPGNYQTASKFQVYGKAVRVVGAGPWYSRFFAPAGQENSDVGFRSESSANGSVFANFAYFGNYTSRIDGPGKVFDFGGVANTTIENIWTEHMICLYWGANTDSMVLRNNRIRNIFADAINMTNGSANNLVSNNDSRASGDDSFALFNAQDAGGGENTGNIYENLTSTLTWRAAGIAVYGGYNNIFRNIHVADTLVYSGITISSLDFGIPMVGFGANPPTRFENISLVRCGGHFWGAQTFPAIWIFSASKVFQGIRVSDVDIVDPTYSGIMFQTNYVGGQPQFPVTDTIFTNVSISGAQKSGDAFDAKSGFGIWVNELPEPGQGPAVGSATFTNLRFSNNFQNIKNTTTTFTINQN
jgi:hypothetical protein